MHGPWRDMLAAKVRGREEGWEWVVGQEGCGAGGKIERHVLLRCHLSTSAFRRHNCKLQLDVFFNIKRVAGLFCEPMISLQIGNVIEMFFRKQQLVKNLAAFLRR